MSAKVDQFCDRLRDRLHSIEARLESVKTHIHSLPEKAREVLVNKLGEAHTKLHAEKNQVEQSMPLSRHSRS